MSNAQSFTDNIFGVRRTHWSLNALAALIGLVFGAALWASHGTMGRWAAFIAVMVFLLLGISVVSEETRANRTLNLVIHESKLFFWLIVRRREYPFSRFKGVQCRIRRIVGDHYDRWVAGLVFDSGEFHAVSDSVVHWTSPSERPLCAEAQQIAVQLAKATNLPLLSEDYED